MPKLSEEERALEGPIPEGMKRCSRCRDDKTPEMFDRSAKQPDGRGLQCKECRKRVKAESLAANPIPPAKRREYTARWKARHPQRAKASERRHGLRRYGLTPERYAQMVTDQRGVCAICHKPESVVDPQSGETKPLAVDHCHGSNQPRALLCQRCNVAIGMLANNPEIMRRAADYIEEWTWKLESLAV